MPYISTPENLKILGALVYSLRELQIDELLPRERLANLLKGKPHLLHKAKTLVEGEQGCIFVTVIGVGLKKLDPKDADVVGQKARQKAQRGLGKAQGQIVGVVRAYEGDMSAQERSKLSQELNKLGLAIQFCE